MFRGFNFKCLQNVREENHRPFVNVGLDGLCLGSLGSFKGAEILSQARSRGQ